MKTTKQLQRGDYDYKVSDDGLLLFNWIDNEPETVASNYHGTAPTSVKRTQKDGIREQVTCFEAVRDFNMHMGAMDMADMLCGSYGLSRKRTKWWHRLFFGLINRALVNANIVYRQICEN
ncbi:PiggyBac transposable element-derived protein 4 [Plakobranchus ocellatus]|uniref:PiggyBac transposable element-derived protein 4 n=1 Tax=Plakobranchus ocellatus TaxID=259542 RepID=A0AAV4DA03_9GAST|nr:PiggyBac transposable element-derived protein 4 [Plakobranchus ocellatus]